MARTALGMTTGLIGACILMAGCATNISKPTALPQPTKERLGTFKVVEFEHVSVVPEFKASANLKAARKIDELLIAGMMNVFPGMKVVDQSSGKAADKTLVIRPVIKEIKFIGGMARFWVGPMAGSSAVLMQVDYIDKGSGGVIGSTQFYRVANAWGGGQSMGGSDNMMLSELAQDVLNYTVSNR
jgi:hypothetical protein